MYLDTIYAKRYERIKALKEATPLADLKETVDNQAKLFEKRRFKEALTKSGMSVIGEIKKASPSKGIFDAQLDSVKIAQVYEQYGVSAISVLTEPDYFLGDYDTLLTARKACQLPLLNKDFIFDPWQVYKAKAIGADAILLIATMLETPILKELYHLAYELELDVLLEIHDEEDLEKALSIGAHIIGINNRDLHSFRVDLETTLRLSKQIPKDKLIISESGIRDEVDLALLKEAKIDGVLIGESFILADCIEEKVARFVQVSKGDETKSVVSKSYETRDIVDKQYETRLIVGEAYE